MTPNNLIYHLNIEYDKSKLMEEFNSATLSIYDPSIKEKISDDWSSVKWEKEEISIRSKKTSGFLKNPSEFPEVFRILKQLNDLLDTQIEVMFTVQRKNKTLPMHTDHQDFPSAVNIVIGDNIAGIKYNDHEEFFYNCALINTQEYHGVKSTPAERIIVKYSIFNKKFNESKNCLKVYETL